jgi:hypothetical protein
MNENTEFILSRLWAVSISIVEKRGGASTFSRWPLPSGSLPVSQVIKGALYPWRGPERGAGHATVSPAIRAALSVAPRARKVPIGADPAARRGARSARRASNFGRRGPRATFCVRVERQRADTVPSGGRGARTAPGATLMRFDLGVTSRVTQAGSPTKSNPALSHLCSVFNRSRGGGRPPHTFVSRKRAAVNFSLKKIVIFKIF